MTLVPRARWVWLVVVGLVLAVAGAAVLVVPVLTDRGGEADEGFQLDTFPSKTRSPVLRVYLKPGGDIDAVARRNELQRDWLELVFDMPEGQAWKVLLPPGTSLEESREVEKRLEADPAVDDVVGHSPAISQQTPNDPEWSVRPGRDRQWSLRRIRPGEAWRDPAVRADQAGLVALVIDGPMDRAHPDLGVEPAPGPQRPPETHGTFVSGVMAAQTDNGRGIASPPWRQTIAHTDMFCKGCGFEAGVDHALEAAGLSPLTVAVIGSARRVVANASFCRAFERRRLLPPFRKERVCDPDHVPEADEVRRLRRAFDSGRVLWVFGSGNDGARTVAFPARHPYALAVGASDRLNDRAEFSNWGPQLDVVAPGDDLYSTVPGGRYQVGRGTSYAAPLVSGVAVALWKHEPQLTAQQVMKRLLASGGRAGKAPRIDEVGFGVVDMHRAFTLDTTPPTIRATPHSTEGALMVHLEVVDDVRAHGLAPIDERVRHSEGVERFVLDFAQVPTSAIAAVRWSVDGGRWHDLPIDPTAPQPYLTDIGLLCQVCTDIRIPQSELKAVPEHLLVVRAWDSSSKTCGPGFAEKTLRLSADGSARASGSATAMLVDHSYSMRDPFGTTTRLESAQRAARDVVELLGRSQQLGGRHRLALVPFAGDAQPGPLTDDVARLRDRIDGLVPVATGTNIGAAIRDGLAALLATPGAEGRSIVLLSDGEPNQGLSAEGILEGPVAEAQRHRIPIHTVAFGDKGPSLLRRISELTGGVAAVGTSPEAVEEALVTAGHRSSGFLVGKGRGRSMAIDMPAEAAGLRVSIIATAGVAGERVRLVSPSGRAVDAQIEAGVPGTPPVATVSVPSPEGGQWRIEAPVEVTAVASVQPGRDLDLGAPPPDPDPPAVADGPRLTAAGPPANRPRSWSELAALSLVVLGALLALTGITAEAGRRAWMRRRQPWLELSVTEGPGAGVRLLARSGDLVGSGGAAAVRLSDGSVSARHACVVREADRWMVVDLEPGGRLIRNGSTVEAAPIEPGDTLAFGSTTLTVARELDRPPGPVTRLRRRRPAAASLVLVVLVAVQVALAVDMVLVWR